MDVTEFLEFLGAHEDTRRLAEELALVVELHRPSRRSGARTGADDRRSPARRPEPVPVG
jgi:hypothetical protein